LKLKKTNQVQRQVAWRRQAALVLGGLLLAAPTLAQDVKTIVTTVCVACHTEDGNSVVPMFPKIAGLQEAYIAKQLQDFMSGKRKSDIMAPIVAQLKPEDVQPLAVYFSSQKLQRGAPTDRLAASAGKVLFNDGNEESGVPACAGCHQPKGAGFGIYPRIGGQHVDYVKQQLKSFATGERSNDPSRFMRVTAKRMTEDEINDVAEYLVGQGDK
jgi:cytochrome c553